MDDKEKNKKFEFEQNKGNCENLASTMEAYGFKISRVEPFSGELFEMYIKAAYFGGKDYCRIAEFAEEHCWCFVGFGIVVEDGDLLVGLQFLPDLCSPRVE